MVALVEEIAPTVDMLIPSLPIGLRSKIIFLKFGGIMHFFNSHYFFNIYSSNTIVHSFVLHRLPCPSSSIFIASPQEKPPRGCRASRESNSSMPYSKPTHYELSHAAPFKIFTTSMMET
jgi:hypothetical protein